jgi:hypothetical protein
MLARDGIASILHLHLAAAEAYRRGYAYSAASILASPMPRRKRAAATIDTDEPGSSV